MFTDHKDDHYYKHCYKKYHEISFFPQFEFVLKKQYNVALVYFELGNEIIVVWLQEKCKLGNGKMLWYWHGFTMHKFLTVIKMQQLRNCQRRY